jgi:hypothetical protein
MSMRALAKRLDICYALVRRTELGTEPPYSDRVLEEFCNALALDANERQALRVHRIRGLGKLDISGLCFEDVAAIVQLRDRLANAVPA